MSLEEKRFNLRVYGLLVNENKQVLLSKEHKADFSFIKFPGGGLEWGEGLQEGLAREFKEELGIDVSIKDHFYTTDFFQESAFNINDQLISVYYLINSNEINSIENGFMSKDEKAPNDFFIWKDLADLSSDYVTFPIDRIVLDKLKCYFKLEE